MTSSESHDAGSDAIDRVVEAIESDAHPGPGADLTAVPHPLPAGVTLASPWRRLGSWALEGLLFAVTLGIGWAIWAYALGGGQTPAKKLLGLRVVLSDQAEAAGMSRMFFLRGLVGGLLVPIAVGLTLGVLLFMPFWDRRNQNLWDKLSSCVVIHDPDRVWTARTEASAAAHPPGTGAPWRR